MNLDDVREQLFRGFHKFYQNKMVQFPAMLSWEQEFMKAVMKLLMEQP